MQDKIDVAELLSEPLPLYRLAEHFDVSRWTMPSVLATIPGVVRIGGLYRVPVRSMPPRYLVSVGIIQPATIDVVKIGDSCDAGRKAGT